MTPIPIGLRSVVTAALVLLAALAAPAGAEIKVGDKFNKDNVDQLKDYISPGMEWCIKHGFPITIGETKKVEWPKAYKEATEKYSSQVKLSSDGLNQGEKSGITDDWFTVSALVNSGH